MIHYRNIILITAFLIITLCTGLFYHHVHNTQLSMALFASCAVILLLVTGLFKEYYTLLAFLTLMVITKVVTAHTAFAGFTTPAFWLTCSSIILGVATKQTGLATSCAHLLSQYCQKNYLVMLIGVSCFGALLALAMPSSTGRMFILLPIFTEFACQCGFKPGSKGYIGIALCGALASNFIGFTFLPANLPNLILMGAASSVYHIHFSYTHYFITQFPILGLVKLIALIALCHGFFYQKPRLKPQLTPYQPFAKEAKRLLVILTLLLIAWISDSITHLAPAWPALIAALACLLPTIGILSQQETVKNFNIEPLFLVAGLIGFSTVLNQTGLIQQLGQYLLNHVNLQSHAPLKNLYIISLTSMLTSIVTTTPSTPAILTPMAQHFAQLTALPLRATLLAQIIGCSTLIFPYQAPPLIIAMRLGNLPMQDTLKITLSMTLITLVFLIPLQWLWWQYLHIF